MSSTASAKELRAAWDDMIASLERARDAIDQPELMPPPQSERDLAEGDRYLMGYLHSAIDRSFHEDPDGPAFRNALSIINRGTIDNADAIYFYAPLSIRCPHPPFGCPLINPNNGPLSSLQKRPTNLRQRHLVWHA